MGEGEDVVAWLEAIDAFAELDDGAGDVAAKDRGEGYGETLFGGAGAHLPVNGIDADGVDADEDLAGGGPGVGEVFVFELGWSTVLVENNSFHEGTSGGVRCTGGAAGGLRWGSVGGSGCEILVPLVGFGDALEEMKAAGQELADVGNEDELAGEPAERAEGHGEADLVAESVTGPWVVGSVNWEVVVVLEGAETAVDPGVLEEGFV